MCRNNKNPMQNIPNLDSQPGAEGNLENQAKVMLAGVADLLAI